MFIALIIIRSCPRHQASNQISIDVGEAHTIYNDFYSDYLNDCHFKFLESCIMAMDTFPQQRNLANKDWLAFECMSAKYHD